MGDLVIGHREGGARARIEDLAAELLGPHRDEPCLAQRAVDVHGIGHGRDAVFGHHDHLAAARGRVVDQRAAHGVDLAQVLLHARVREIRAEALQVVVEMRQIGERERRIARLHHVQRRLGDPVAGGDVGERAPEPEQRELPELRVEPVVQLMGVGVVSGSCGRRPGTSAAASRSSRRSNTCCTTRTSWRR